MENKRTSKRKREDETPSQVPAPNSAVGTSTGRAGLNNSQKGRAGLNNSQKGKAGLNNSQKGRAELNNSQKGKAELNNSQEERAELNNSQKETDQLSSAPVPFVWTTSRALALLFAMIGKKPAGTYKDLNIQKIHREVSEALNMPVPLVEVYKVLFGLWNTHQADSVELKAMLNDENSKEEEKAKEAEEAASESSCSSTSQASTSSACQASTSSAGQASTSSAGQAATSSGSQASTSTAGQASTSRASQASTSTVGQASTSTAGQASTSRASQASTSISGQAATSSERQNRRITLEEFKKLKMLRVNVSRMDSMLNRIQMEKLLNYKTDSSKTALEDAFSNINIEVKEKQAQAKVKDDASIDSTIKKNSKSKGKETQD